jgi:solute carrier family 8 (sodium/calcium exchanger)
MLKETNIEHEYDLWHIVKGIKKKLLAPKIAELNPWVRAVGHHAWYSAATCDRDASVMKEKWLGMLNHIRNRHTWYGDQIHGCDHEPLSPEHPRPWLKTTSKAFSHLRKVATDERLLRDFAKVRTTIVLQLKSIFLL